eukprot:TRINITY_DN93815_c0_g1_i1.p1 TRINITY_DN93815_c0_g1~~TRINITY_DN93815_c0_g1_i1.p1  ORF type:complete len:265 (+),score=34.91 TRINITY_DN93815_c0_g1_i1:59-853(+)
MAMISSIPTSDRLLHLENLAFRGRSQKVYLLGGASAGLTDVLRTTHGQRQYGGNLLMGMQAVLAVGSGLAVFRSTRNWPAYRIQARRRLVPEHLSASITVNESEKESPAALSSLPGDLAVAIPDSSRAMFDPLGFYSFEGRYIDQVIAAFGVDITRLRWYREAELMHGRIAMLANMQLLLEGTVQLSFLPHDERDMLQLLQAVMMMEVYRGSRLFRNAHSIVGDFGVGFYQEHQEQTSNEYKELQNARLAMLAFPVLFHLQQYV